MATRILLIDDDRDAISLMAKLLARHDCDVRCVHDPLIAVETAQEFEPSGICLDIGMPDMDGYTLARSLRQVPSLRDCRIVAVSGHPPDKERLAKAGIDLHLLKPVASRVLCKALCDGAV